jgi:hypothetical protein
MRKLKIFGKVDSSGFDKQTSSKYQKGSLKNGVTIANRLGLEETELYDLLNGKANLPLNQTLFLDEQELQDFYDNKVSLNLAKSLKMN